MPPLSWRMCRCHLRNPMQTTVWSHLWCALRFAANRVLDRQAASAHFVNDV